MDFEKAKSVSHVIHLFVFALTVLVPMGYIGFTISLPAVFAFIPIYIVGWIASLSFFNGCIISHVENVVSRRIYGLDFYPEYGFKGSYAYRAFAFFAKKYCTESS